jgi:precorrin-6A synthase
VRKVLVIGIGAGDPEFLTVAAVRALNEADVFFVLDKGEVAADLVGLRRQILERFVDRDGHRVVVTTEAPRGRDVAAWHERRADVFERLVRDELGDDGVGAFLVWGDPALYDSTLRVLERVEDRGSVAFSLVSYPGISAPQALAARFRIPLHGVGRPLLVTTGRRLAAGGWPDGVDDVVVMLDGGTAFTTLDPSGLYIHWGAYLGTPDEILIAGPLDEVADEIVRVRADARAVKGWMFDTYLLQRGPR